MLMYTNSVPAILYIKAVRMYAQSRGLPFFTHLEVMIARRLYEEEAITRN
jgi:hypothetical protein